MRALELRIPPVALGLVCALLAYLGKRLFPELALSGAGEPVLAGVLLLTGTLIALLGVVEFRRARTTTNPMRPDNSSSLVTRGIYRVTRNPMYLGFALALLGFATWLSHGLAYASVGLFVVCLQRLQIEPEERMLRARFGAEFDAYARAVRRWI